MLMSLSSPTLAGLTLLLAYEYNQSSMPLETALAVIPLALLAFAGAKPFFNLDSQTLNQVQMSKIHEPKYHACMFA